MLELLLAPLHPRWTPSTEVAVRQPSRGWIDLVLHDAVATRAPRRGAPVGAAAARAAGPLVARRRPPRCRAGRAGRASATSPRSAACWSSGGHARHVTSRRHSSTAARRLPGSLPMMPSPRSPDGAVARPGAAMGRAWTGSARGRRGTLSDRAMSGDGSRWRRPRLGTVRAERWYPSLSVAAAAEQTRDDHPAHPRREDLGRARRRRGPGRAGRPRGRPPPRPRGHQPAGVHRAARARAARPPPRQDRRHGRPLHARPRRAACRCSTCRRPPRSASSRRTAREFGIPIHAFGSDTQGIVHVIGPELGLTQPGMTIVCGDSHTATHGAFGALAFGIGTSEVEMVLATQTLLQRTPKTYEVRVDGRLSPGVSAKDIILALIARIGIGGGTGHVFEYRGEAIRALTMEQRMTICNMSIEGGARAGLIAPDDTTFEYVHGRRHAPQGAAWDDAVATGGTLPTDDGARFDKSHRRSTPARSSRWSPRARTRAWASPITGRVPRPEDCRGRRSDAAASSTRSSTWASSPASRSPASRWTSCSSARAPTAGSATCGSPPACSRTARSPTASRLMVVPGLAAGEGARPSARAWTRSSAPPAPSGASPAARCASR